VALGKTYVRLGKVALALRQYRNALDAKPLDPQIHYELGLLYRLQGDNNMALAEFETALTHDPNHFDAQTKLADVLVELGQLEAAIEAYKRVLQARPHDVDAQLGIGIALREKGLHGEALNHLVEAKSLNPDRPQSRPGRYPISSGPLLRSPRPIRQGYPRI
jgi:tetratricopeptide (TPR) repeat protein